MLIKFECFSFNYYNRWSTVSKLKTCFFNLWHMKQFLANLSQLLYSFSCFSTKLHKKLLSAVLFLLLIRSNYTTYFWVHNSKKFANFKRWSIIVMLYTRHELWIKIAQCNRLNLKYQNYSARIHVIQYVMTSSFPPATLCPFINQLQESFWSRTIYRARVAGRCS